MISKKYLIVSLLALAFCMSSAVAQVVVTQSGQTSVALSKAFVGALGSLGVTPGLLSPSSLTNGVATFPITGGAVDAKTAAGQITHGGGLTLTAGGTTVALQNFTIDTTGATPILYGVASVNGSVAGTLPLFNIQFSPGGITLPLKPLAGVLVVISGAKLTLTSTAASTLNSVFQVNAFTAGFPIGYANVQAFVLPNR